MSAVQWTLRGREFTHCSCAYGCPCQFNALPTHGHCHAMVGVAVDVGHHGATRLDGVRFGGVFAWPGPIHLGKGQVLPIVDDRTTPAQREAVLRIMSGQDTEPGATIFQVFSATFDKVFDPVFARIDLSVDVDARRASMHVPGVMDARGEPIVNPVTGEEHRVRINLPKGFEYTLAEVGRGWLTTTGPIPLNLEDSHAHFVDLHMTQSGVVR